MKVNRVLSPIFISPADEDVGLLLWYMCVMDIILHIVCRFIMYMHAVWGLRVTGLGRTYSLSTTPNIPPTVLVLFSPSPFLLPSFSAASRNSVLVT